MSQKLTSHQINECNDKVEIIVVDDPGSGGASHRYDLIGFNTESNPSRFESLPTTKLEILFQNGPIKEVGVNGTTHEQLLAVLEHRLQGFQEGPYKCAENGEALTHIRAAIAALHSRTQKRVERGVEGTHAI